MKSFLRFFMLFVLCLASLQAQATKRYWVATVSGNWNATANWSATSGGAGGASAPATTADTAIFNGVGGRNGNCSINLTISIGRMHITGYTGTITQSSTFQLTCGTGGWEQTSGTFTGGSGSKSISVSGTSFGFTLSGGSFSQGAGAMTVGSGLRVQGGTFVGGTGVITSNAAMTVSSGSFTSTANDLVIGANLTISGGTFAHNNGTIKSIVSGQTITSSVAGGVTFYNMTYAPTAAGAVMNIASTTPITISKELLLAGTGNTKFNGGQLTLTGDLRSTNIATGVPGTTVFYFTGNRKQKWTGSGTAGGGRFGPITIAKTNADSVLTLSGIISIQGSFNYVAGLVDASTFTSSVNSYGTFNLDGENASGGTLPFYKLIAKASSNITLTGNLNVRDNLGIDASATLNANGKNIVNGGSHSNNGGTFTAGSGTVTFEGDQVRELFKTGATETFSNVVVNKAGGFLRVKSPMVITGSLTLTNGPIRIKSGNYMEFTDNATCVGGGIRSYVGGPVRKVGNDAFVFPLGDTLLNDSVAFHPLGMSAPGAVGDKFEGKYLAQKPALAYALVDSLEYVDTLQHWTLNRMVGISNVKVTLGWNANAPVKSVGSLRVAGWNGSTWLDLGQQALVIAWPIGTVSASLNAVFNSNIATLTLSASKPPYRGYAVVRPKLDGNFYEANNNLWFKFDDGYNDQAQGLTYRVISTSTNTPVALIGSANNQALSFLGDNRFRLDLFSGNSPIPTGFYILEVTDEKGAKYYLRFRKN
jgi:hypothetical protein